MNERIVDEYFGPIQDMGMAWLYTSAIVIMPSKVNFTRSSVSSRDRVLHDWVSIPPDTLRAIVGDDGEIEFVSGAACEEWEAEHRRRGTPYPRVLKSEDFYEIVVDGHQHVVREVRLTTEVLTYPHASREIEAYFEVTIRIGDQRVVHNVRTKEDALYVHERMKDRLETGGEIRWL